jgi:hypothetical protein
MKMRTNCRVGLAQLVRFLVLKLNQSDSNPRFDMSVVLRLIILSVKQHPVDSKMLLVINFVNLKIKSAQFFRGARRGSVYVRAFIGVSAHV